MQPNENEQFKNTNEQFENANSSPQQNENMNNQFILSDKDISRSEYATKVLEEKQINTPYFTDNFHTPGYLEHREIRRRGNILGFAFCLTNVTNLFLFSLISIILIPLGVDVLALSEKINEPFYSMVYQVMYSIIAFMVPFLIAAGLSKVKLNNIIPFKKAEKGTTFPFLLIGFGFTAIANMLSNILLNILRMFGISDYQMDLDLPTGVLGFLISVIATSIVPALVEEFAYRGVFLGLLKKYGEGFSIIASAIMFGLMHGNLSQIPFAFMLGLVFGFIRVKSDSIIPVILLHFINNFLSLIMMYITDGKSEIVAITTNTIYFAVALISIALGVLVLKKGSFETFKIKEANTHLYESQKSSALYAAPFMIISYIFTFIMILISESLN